MNAKTIRKQIVVSAFLSASLLSGTGCASVLSRATEEKAGLYPGVRGNLETIANPVDEFFPPWMIVTPAVIDLPFCFAVDTVFLPLDALNEAFGEQE